MPSLLMDGLPDDLHDIAAKDGVIEQYFCVSQR